MTSSTCFTTSSVAAPRPNLYCGGKSIERVIEYVLVGDNNQDVHVKIQEHDTLNNVKKNKEISGITSYSWFGSNQPIPKGFVVALLLDGAGEIFVFEHEQARWIEYGDYRYDECR